MKQEPIRSARVDAQIAPEAVQTIRLGVEDQGRFAEMLIDPPELSPAMERARAIHQRLARGE